MLRLNGRTSRKGAILAQKHSFFVTQMERTLKLQNKQQSVLTLPENPLVVAVLENGLPIEQVNGYYSGRIFALV